MSMRMRRGSAPTVQGGETFGPVQGEAAVRANAGARAVSDPGGGVAFTSSADLQTKITNNPTGTIFVAANNIDWSTTVSTTTKASKIYIPGNRVMDGGNREINGLSIGDGAEVHGGIWTHFGSTGVSAGAPIFTIGGGAAKLVQDVTAHTNFEKGIILSGNNTTLDHCTMHTNGRYGWEGHQAAAGTAPTYPQTISGSVVTNCEWYNNNTRGLNMDGAAGGTKMLHCLDAHIANCWGHNNTGSGLWFDYNPGTHVVENNVFENNARWGIFYEVGTGAASNGHTASGVFRNNLVVDNVTNDDNTWFNSVGLLSSCSDGQLNGGGGYEFHNNIVDTSGPRAMGFIDHSTPHPFDVKNFWAHDNDVWLRTNTTGRVGGHKDPANAFDPFTVGANNDFTGNHYHVQNTGLAYWVWAGTNRTWAQWQALGHDQTGSLETI